MDELVILGIIGVGLLLTSIISSISQLRSDLARTNATLNKMAKHIGLPDEVTADLHDELISLIAEGKKIKAIKRYRMETGLGLKEAKDYVDSLSAKTKL
ncbi:ribosomal protein L7/L12 [Neobacillus drentensis]|uniref:ribosomal protein L7/L12 n=1 Tax=Neobacillus drentensis TaxID=220684 RepID=UPI001F2C6560|nr:ribosomal protein L7/L12 [Neobacillus drentensis]ULT54473.1 ribosomal protein L7/L12 [Neobacillus drentensis]